jgi:hypothetical protein
VLIFGSWAKFCQTSAWILLSASVSGLLGLKRWHFLAVNFTVHVYFNERNKHFGLMEIKHLFVLYQIAHDSIECRYVL